MNENYEIKLNQIFNLNDWNKQNGSLMNDKLIAKTKKPNSSITNLITSNRKKNIVHDIFWNSLHRRTQSIDFLVIYI